jgi:hypothetical protein
MLKKDKYTEINKGYNLQNHLQILKDLKQDFIFENSTYTSKIETNTTVINFITKNLNKTAFIGANKIKSDLKQYTGNLPTTKADECEYFTQNLKQECLNYVINFDFTKAYLTILKNDNFISNDTFDYCKNLGKSERLAAVGMLARKKIVIQYQDGKPILNEIKRSDTSGLFFYCVQKTYFIINEIRKNTNARFLFSWVDGIYFEIETEQQKNEIYNDVFKICELYNLNFTCEILTDYVSTFENNIFQIYFNKGGDEKRFTIPSNELNLNYNIYKKINANV